MINPIAAFQAPKVRRWAWFLACCFLLFLQSALILLHEPWLDEWQALQLAVQSPTLSDLLDNLRYEGHPPLYYLLLRGAAAIVPLPWVLVAVQLPIALATQSIILFRSFSDRILRLCFALSAFVLIDYGTIARSLSLGVLLFLVVWASLSPVAQDKPRKGRWPWIWLCLLPAVDMLFGVLSLFCLVILVREGRWSWRGFAAWVIVSLLSAWTVIPAHDMVPALPPDEGPLIAAFKFLGFSAQLLVPLPFGYGGLQWNTTFPTTITLVLGYITLVAGWWMRPTLRTHRWLLVALYVFMLSFSMFVYSLPIRHLSLLALFFIALIWREEMSGLRKPKPFPIWLGMTACCGILLAAVNLVRPFDTAAPAALWIRQAGLTGAHWASYPDSSAQGVAMMNGMNFTRLGRICQQDFVRWNNGGKAVTAPAVKRRLDEIAGKYGQFYLLSESRLSFGHTFRKGDFVKLAHIPAGFNGQNYHVYLYAPTMPPRKERPAPCQANRLRFHPWTLKEQAWRQSIRQSLRRTAGWGA